MSGICSTLSKDEIPLLSRPKDQCSRVCAQCRRLGLYMLALNSASVEEKVQAHEFLSA